MKVNYKKIDETVIVVLEGRILSRTIPSGNEGDKLVEEILQCIKALNEYSLSDEEYLIEKADLIRFMIPKKERVQLKLDLGHTEVDINKEEQNIANMDLEKARRIGDISGQFEYDPKGRVYLKGFSVPIPEKLADALLDAHYNPESKYTVESLVNFWQWAVLNPNKKARIDLFGWFDTGDFVITEQGLIVAYRNVDVKTKGISSKLENFINEKYIQVKKNKQSPKKYAVVKKDGEFKCLFLNKHPNAKEDSNYKGLLSDLYADVNTREGSTTYTDNYTRTMNIKMGEEVSMPREECDEDQSISCSSGLHFMSPAYNLRCGNTTVVVLVNPYNIVAFPNYDNTKGRSCAYLPIGKAQIKNGNIVTLGDGTYDFEYSKYTSEKLSEMINNSDFDSLVADGLIADDLTEEDFNIVKAQVVDIINKRIVDVE
jgi:hypothetical protein